MRQVGLCLVFYCSGGCGCVGLPGALALAGEAYRVFCGPAYERSVERIIIKSIAC